MREFGSIFKEKYGKDPRELTLEEINKIAIKDNQVKPLRSNIVSSRGNVLKVEVYEIDKKIDEILKSV